MAFFRRMQGSSTLLESRGSNRNSSSPSTILPEDPYSSAKEFCSPAPADPLHDKRHKDCQSPYTQRMAGYLPLRLPLSDIAQALPTQQKKRIRTLQILRIGSKHARRSARGLTAALLFSTTVTLISTPLQFESAQESPITPPPMTTICLLHPNPNLLKLSLFQFKASSPLLAEAYFFFGIRPAK